MRLIDEQYLRTPFYGYMKMTEYLRQEKQNEASYEEGYVGDEPDFHLPT